MTLACPSMAASPIPLYVVITPSHRVLFDRFFLPSLDQTQFVLHAAELDQAGDGEFLADDFKRCILFKLDEIITSISRHDGQVIIWSDIDIQFFGMQAADILKPFEQPGLQFAAQRLNQETDLACGGFYAIRCCSESLDFFRAVRETTVSETHGNEQEAINLLLRRPEALHWQLLDARFYARSHGVRMPCPVVMHHATCILPGDAVRQKIKLLSELENYHQWSASRRMSFQCKVFAKAALRHCGLRVV
jgi:Nucleotide-diphospho-sugar transferase